MKFYHGTTQENWEQIQKDGELFGYTRIVSNDRKTVLQEFRLTYLATEKKDAECYGDVILEVEYDPYREGAQCNAYDKGCWQLRVYEPIPLENVKLVSKSDKYKTLEYGILKEIEDLTA